MANKKGCSILSEKNKKLLKEIRERRVESEIRIKVLNKEIENLKQRVNITNERMRLLL